MCVCVCMYICVCMYVCMYVGMPMYFVFYSHVCCNILENKNVGWNPSGFLKIIFHRFSVKQKAIPLLSRTGPEGSRSWRLPDFKTAGT
jgi:hypothetical protein